MIATTAARRRLARAGLVERRAGALGLTDVARLAAMVARARAG